jgi:hypothetical protein
LADKAQSAGSDLNLTSSMVGVLYPGTVIGIGRSDGYTPPGADVGSNPIKVSTRQGTIRNQQLSPLGNRKQEVLIKLPILEGRLAGRTETGQTNLGPLRQGWKTEEELGAYEAGIGIGFTKGKSFAGLYGEVAAVETKQSVAVGSTAFGLGLGLTEKGGSAEGMAGYRNGRFGLSGEASAGSVEATVGLNAAGYNVGLTGEAGIKAGLGVEIGKRTRVKLGPFTVGINIGEALGS